MKTAIFILILVLRLTDTLRADPGNSNSLKTLGRLRAVLEEYEREERGYLDSFTIPKEAVIEALKVYASDYRYVTYKIKNNQLIADTILEKSNEDKGLSNEEHWNQFTARLMGPDPKYAIYGQTQNGKLVSIFVVWIPESLDLRIKMKYTRSSEKIKSDRRFYITDSIRAENAERLNWDNVKDKLE